MPFPLFAYPRAAMQAQVLARPAGGYSETQLAKLPGYPSRQTLHRWGKADPAFALAMAREREWGQGERRGVAISAQAFDAARAEAFLLQVRRGHRLGDLLRMSDWPNRALLNAWKRQKPDFAQALAASKRFAREMRDRTPRRPFDQMLADQIIVRVSRGESLAELMKEPAMPGRPALRRWRRRQPEFAAALKTATRWCHAATMRTRRRSTSELTEAIAAHIRQGGSLRSAAQSVRGAPHRVTLYGWMRTRPEFAREIEWAKRERDDRMEDEALGASSARFAAIRQRYGQLHGGAPRRR